MKNSKKKSVKKMISRNKILLKLSALIMSMITSINMTIMLAYAAATTAADDGGGGSLDVPDSVNDIITFFVSLLKIVGGVVGIIGAVMFFMAVKDQDAHGKQTGMLTFVAGAGVFAVATAFSNGAIFA